MNCIYKYIYIIQSFIFIYIYIIQSVPSSLVVAVLRQKAHSALLFIHRRRDGFVPFLKLLSLRLNKNKPGISSWSIEREKKKKKKKRERERERGGRRRLVKEYHDVANILPDKSEKRVCKNELTTLKFHYNKHYYSQCDSILIY